MQALYFVLVGVHIVALVVTGIMWTIVDMVPHSRLKKHLRDIRVVHFGALHLTAWLLGLNYAFDKLRVPDWHQTFFPIGLGLLVFFSGLGYVFPRPPDIDPWYYWTRGWPAVLAMIGLAGFIVCLLWTATVLVVYAVR